MPGAASDSPGRHASTLGRLSGSWTVRAKKVCSSPQASSSQLKACAHHLLLLQAERNGERSAIHLPSGERYTGSWNNNKQEGVSPCNDTS